MHAIHWSTCFQHSNLQCTPRSLNKYITPSHTATTPARLLLPTTIVQLHTQPINTDVFATHNHVTLPTQQRLQRPIHIQLHHTPKPSPRSRMLHLQNALLPTRPRRLPSNPTPSLRPHHRPLMLHRVDQPNTPVMSILVPPPPSHAEPLGWRRRSRSQTTPLGSKHTLDHIHRRPLRLSPQTYKKP